MLWIRLSMHTDFTRFSPPSHQAGRFVWLEDKAPWRNQFVRFERSFVLASIPASFELNLFADTRYRLWVNGCFVAVGPGRFVTQHPEFDTHSLVSLLRPGPNLIAVEVNFYGASSFQSMPDGQPGFLAWGGDKHIDLATPGEWRGYRLNAWRWDAPPFSFAQGPVEICDTRLSGTGTAAPLVVLEGERAPWNLPAPYSGPPIPYFIHRPKRIELASPITNTEQRFGFMTRKIMPGEPGMKTYAGLATWIFSPRAQEVRISCFWSTLLCNGNLLCVDTGTPYGNHGYCTMALKQGWNLLAGELEALTENWAYCIGIPHAAGLSLHGRRDIACNEPLAVYSGLRKPSLPTPADAKAPEGWRLHLGDPWELTPARMVAWDKISDPAVRDLGIEKLSEVAEIDASSATWCFSFDGEFLGHIVLDVEAPAGAVLDVACDDWQSANGTLALYQTNPFTETADRFILRGGRQRVDLFHPRGGKYVQATLRAPRQTARLVLHDIFVRSRQTLGADQTKFSCDQATLNWVWPVAMRTLIVSTDESYSDCPWRERGCYIADTYVNLHLHALLSRDLRIARRVLRLFAQGQLSNGLLAACTPAWLRKPYYDFTLIWLLALHDEWALSGDLGLARELWPVVTRIWESPAWKCHASGLWNSSAEAIFVDWGILQSERSGEANAALNLFRFGAAKACARLAEALAQPAHANRFLADAVATGSRLLELLWDEEQGRLRPSLGAGTPALHANILALAFGLGTQKVRSRIIASIEPMLRANLQHGFQQEKSLGYLDLYFLYYALPALAENGRPDLAEFLIEEHYGFLRSLNDDTLPESFNHVAIGNGSRCHSWSGAAAIYAARYILGLRQARPGAPRELIFEPLVHGIKQAAGRIAHPDGWIDVSWRRKNGVIYPDIQAPPSVRVIRKVPEKHPLCETPPSL